VTSSEAVDVGAAAGPKCSPTDGGQQIATAVASDFSRLLRCTNATRPQKILEFLFVLGLTH
jgi:hypothetical protein